MNNRLKMAWADLTASSTGKKSFPIGMENYFKIRRFECQNSIDELVADESPDVIAFEFDYPDRDSLSLMAGFKRAHPSVPMIMITLQHSEKLAVWAFRSRMADYLVKPIPQDEIDRCFQMLTQMVGAKAGQIARAVSSAEMDVPLEVAAHVLTAEGAFLPAIYYVAQNFDQKIQNDEAAKLCAMSPFRFSRGFKEAFGIAFRDYVVRYRLRQAYGMLKNPNNTITDVAFAVGFSDVSYFSRIFKKYFGVSPTEKFRPKSPLLREDESPTAELKIPRDLIQDVVA
jgi:YesN/AraC family two-component response regulator